MYAIRSYYVCLREHGSRGSPRPGGFRRRQGGPQRRKVREPPRQDDIIGRKCERLPDRPDHPLVREQSADEGNPGNGGLPLVDAALEIPGDRLAQPLENLLGGIV